MPPDACRQPTGSPLATLAAAASLLLPTLSHAQNRSTPAPQAKAVSTLDTRPAAQAIRDKLPDVAAARLQKLLASPSARGPQPAARLLLCEALVRSGKHADAIREAAHRDLAGLPEATFWKASALAGLGRWNDALAAFSSLPDPSTGFPFATETAFSRASIMAAAGDHSRALTTLAPLLSSENLSIASRARLWSAEFQFLANQPSEAAALIEALTDPPAALAPQVRYLKGRLSLALGKPEDALAQLEPLTAPTGGASQKIQHAAALGMARALAASGQQDAALAALEKLIGLSPAPDRSLLAAAFDEFSRLNQPPREEADSFLRSWAASDQADLRSLARLAQAEALEAAGKPAEALAICRELTSSNQGSELLPLLILKEARTALAAGDRPAATRTLTTLEPLAATPVLRAWCAWLQGVTAYDDQQFKKAAAAFSTAARNAPDADAKATAAWNAAIAELRTGALNPADPLDLLGSLNTPAARTASAEFSLERALYLAATDQPGARESLEAFLATAPSHPRHFEALAALTELCLSASPPDAAEASRHAKAAATAAQSPEQKETAAWLDVLATGASLGDDALAAAATSFFASFPESPRRSPLRMRLGEMFYRRQNFAAARQAFETIARDDPSHPLSEAALFWAGKSALLSLGQKSENDAVALWEEVYRRNGPLKLEARLQVALVSQRRGDFPAALQYLSGILAATPPPQPAVRWQSLCLKGEILTTQSAGPGQIREALAAFDSVSSDAAAPTPWKHEALVRKGVCLEQLKRTTDALDAYHEVVSSPPASEGPDEYWFHRAGEKALRLLESTGKYEEAVEMARKLSQAPGPRGRAAGNLVSQLALKYGIWLENDAPTAPPP
jgi:TolA-binding protein